MKSFRSTGATSSLVDMFTTLSQNSSAANGTLGTILINDQHRQLLLKYFDNERNTTITTAGATTATLVATLATLATSGTLVSAWQNTSAPQLVVFDSSQQRNVFFTNGSTTITWISPLATATSTIGITTSGVQSYPLPANVSKIKNTTITIGQLVYTPAPVQSIQEWTKLNALPYTSDIPAYFYVYDGVISFWPIPSSTGNVINLNCQIKFADMTYSDYSAGTVTLTAGSNAVTGSATSWASNFPTGVDLTFANLHLIPTPPNGDGLPYPIQSFASNTSLTLGKPIVYTPKNSGVSYTIGQYPLLSADFHDAIVYGALRVYYNSIVKDPDKYQLYNNLFNERLALMEFYLANKQVNVDLSVAPVLTNPNLYTFAPPQ